MAGGRSDPYLGFNFVVEIDSLVVGGFSEVSGMEADTEVHEFREGGLNEYMHKRAGPTKYPGNLVLKRGISDAAGLWSWYADVLQGNIQRKTVSIVLLDNTCQEQRRWSFQRAYPVKWTGPNLRAVSAEVAVESVELAHEGLLPGAPSQSQQMGLGVEFSVQVGASVSASINVSADVNIGAAANVSGSISGGLGF